MKKLIITLPLVLLMIFGSSCGRNKDLSKDIEPIADAMCRNIEIMNKLKTADPADSVNIQKLQADAQKLQIEMTVVYNEFKTKYKEKLNDDRFNKDFARELRKAMLNCPYLSKEDRENFEKEVEE
jgi:hypothetical protein